MKIEGLGKYIFEEVHVYIQKENNSDLEFLFENIYTGLIESAPDDIKAMRVASIGASRKGYLDIKVY